MSSFALARSTLAVRSVASSPSSILSSNALRSFSTSSTRQALKESDANRDKEHISQEYERHKNEHLRNAKEGKGSWKHELASDSEASVKADRDETGILPEEVKKNDSKQQK